MTEKFYLKDGFGRTIDYLRISLTDKCNLRCHYCMPSQGINHVAHEEILTYEEIEKLVLVMAKIGLKKIRLTGGEPLVRKDITTLVKMIKAIPEIQEICLTTNGLLFNEFATQLKQAGLTRVNFSLDTLNDDTFFAITGSHGVEQVFKSIHTALELGFPVKINCVPGEWNKNELTELALLAKKYPVDVRFIELMPIGCAFGKAGLSADFVKNELESKFGKATPLSSQPHSPAKLFSFENFNGKIGFISPMSHAFCSECNRIRLSSSGMLKLCLCFDDAIDVRKILRSGQSEDKINLMLQEEIQKAIKQKPKAHTFNQNKKTLSQIMTEIGG